MEAKGGWEEVQKNLSSLKEKDSAYLKGREPLSSIQILQHLLYLLFVLA